MGECGWGKASWCGRMHVGRSPDDEGRAPSCQMVGIGEAGRNSTTTTTQPIYPIAYTTRIAILPFRLGITFIAPSRKDAAPQLQQPTPGAFTTPYVAHDEPCSPQQPSPRCIAS